MFIHWWLATVLRDGSFLYCSICSDQAHTHRYTNIFCQSLLVTVMNQSYPIAANHFYFHLHMSQFQIQSHGVKSWYQQSQLFIRNKALFPSSLATSCYGLTMSSKNQIDLAFFVPVLYIHSNLFPGMYLLRLYQSYQHDQENFSSQCHQYKPDAMFPFMINKLTLTFQMSEHRHLREVDQDQVSASQLYIIRAFKLAYNCSSVLKVLQ